MRFDRRLKPQNNVNLTPLIDVILMIIIFFMMTSVFKIAPGIELNLPDSASAESVSLTELYITAVSEQEIYVNKVRIELPGLKTAIAKQIEGKDLKKLSVIVEGDKAASYQLMVDILDQLRLQGITGVNLLTSKQAGTAGAKAVPAAQGAQ